MWTSKKDAQLIQSEICGKKVNTYWMQYQKLKSGFLHIEKNLMIKYVLDCFFISFVYRKFNRVKFNKLC